MTQKENESLQTLLPCICLIVQPVKDGGWGKDGVKITSKFLDSLKEQKINTNPTDLLTQLSHLAAEWMREKKQKEAE